MVADRIRCVLFPGKFSILCLELGGLEMGSESKETIDRLHRIQGRFERREQPTRWIYQKNFSAVIDRIETFRIRFAQPIERTDLLG